MPTNVTAEYKNAEQAFRQPVIPTSGCCASHAEVGPYPYTTELPLPGMLAFEDVHFQLIDLPPVAADYMEPWMGSGLEHAEAACLVVDLSDPGMFWLLARTGSSITALVRRGPGDRLGELVALQPRARHLEAFEFMLACELELRD